MANASIVVTPVARGETRTLAVVSFAHLISHFYWLAFVPLLPALHDLLAVSYTDLGLAITIMNVVSMVTQAPTGFLVDRLGARRLLVAGLLLGGGAFIALAAVPSYPMLLGAAAAIGLANAVYHPADYSILSAEIRADRMGRAFSVHTFSGYLGFAIAPPLLLGVSAYGGVPAALIFAGLFGFLAALPLLSGCRAEGAGSGSVDPRRKATQRTGVRALLTPAVLGLTLMFAVLNLSTGMLQTYMVVALEKLHGLPQTTGNLALTVFLFAMVGGILIGGLIADRVRSQSFVAAAGFGLAALVVAFVGTVHASGWTTVSLIAVAGFLAGIIMPSRDMLVRKASPPDAVGRTFGIVTTGFNIGGMVGPVVGGTLIDGHAPAWIFYGSALSMLATVVIAVVVERRSFAVPEARNLVS